MKAKDYIDKKLNESVIPQDDIDFFREGACIDFAYAYQDIFGDDIQLEAIWGNYDPDDEDAVPELIHVFCTYDKGKKGLAVDIQGWQNYDKLVNSFSEYFIDDYHTTDYTSRDEIQDAINNSNGDLAISEFGYKKAKKIIQDNIDFYKPKDI